MSGSHVWQRPLSPDLHPPLLGSLQSPCPVNLEVSGLARYSHLPGSRSQALGTGRVWHKCLSLGMSLSCTGEIAGCRLRLSAEASRKTSLTPKWPWGSPGSPFHGLLVLAPGTPRRLSLLGGSVTGWRSWGGVLLPWQTVGCPHPVAWLIGLNCLWSQAPAVVCPLIP